MGHPMQLLTEHHFGVIYLFVLGACFSIIIIGSELKIHLLMIF